MKTLLPLQSNNPFAMEVKKKNNLKYNLDVKQELSFYSFYYASLIEIYI